MRPRFASGIPIRGVLGGDDHVAGEHDLAAACEGGAVHRGDERLREVALRDAGEPPGTGRDPAELSGGEGLQVHPRGEGRVAGTGDR